MKKKIILILACIIALIPFTGFPDSWKTLIISLLAISIIVIVYREDIRNFFAVPQYPPGRIVEGDSFVESTGPVQGA